MKTAGGRELMLGVKPDGDLIAIRVDDNGNLVVVGAGAAPAATSLKIQDATDNTRLVKVGADGRLYVEVQGTVPVSGPLTDAELRATPVPVSFPADESGLTDAELRATTVPVSGPVTDAQLRASPIPVSFTADEAGLTDAELRAAPVEIETPQYRELTHKVATVTDAGDTDIWTPALGNRIRVYWVYAISDPDQATTPLIKIRFGPGDERYRAYAISKTQQMTGQTDEVLYVNLSEAGSVAVTIIGEEIA